MSFSSDHITGFAIGLGAAALGFYLYKNNQHQVDDFLRSHGIDLPAGGSMDTGNMTLEDLVAEKEKLEDKIAEREYNASRDEGAAAGPSEKAGTKKPASKKA